MRRKGALCNYRTVLASGCQRVAALLSGAKTWPAIPFLTPPAVPASGLNLDTLIGVPEMCRRLSCARITVYRAVRAGQLNPTWIRGKQLFTPAEVERFIAAGTHKD